MFHDPLFRAFGVGIAALQLGAGFGAIASCVRTDRVLVMLATGLVLMFVLLGWRFDEAGELLAVLPWVAGCTVICGWFPRHRNAPPVPLARWRLPWHALLRPRLRRLTVVEIGTLVAVIGALVVATAIDAPDGRLTAVARAVAAAVPTAVFLGVISEQFDSTFNRISSVVPLALSAAMILWLDGMLGESPVWSLVVMVATVTAIEIAIQTKSKKHHP